MLKAYGMHLKLLLVRVVPCPGGLYRTENRQEAVKAISWKQAQQISNRFAALVPYDRDAVHDSILKIEEDNFDPKTKQQRQVYCFAISAKRYALFLKDENGDPVLLCAPRDKDKKGENALAGC